MIPTPQTLQKINRRLDRERRQAEHALAAMRDSVTLHHLGRDGWCLSNGQRVSLAVANILTFHHSVMAGGDSLFGPELSQTWRWAPKNGGSQ